MPKCHLFRHFELSVKTCLIIVTRKFWKVLAQTTACGRDDLYFLLFTCFGRKTGHLQNDFLFLLFN